MINKVLKVHQADNIIVALRDFEKGDQVNFDGTSYTLLEDIPIKHKFAAVDFKIGDTIIMYGVTIGKATQSIHKGSRISIDNVVHEANSYGHKIAIQPWQAPDISKFKNRTFNGYHRKDGKVGTRNFWLVIPLVFCENRNINVIKEVMLERLGYDRKKDYSIDIDQLIKGYQDGAVLEDILTFDVLIKRGDKQKNRLFSNVDGIKFLTHEGGCGGIRQDSETLCRLFAGYIMNANVAGATILSLGCQNAQISLMKDTLKEMYPQNTKPIYFLEQQNSKSEPEYISEAVKKTFVGLIEANKYERLPASLRHLNVGLECGGSDGFSGISANPALGYTSDLLVALGGNAILSEFPELNGVEQELINRCVNQEMADKFASIMNTYAHRAQEAGSGFHMNPSPGNIKDGLITDAMKSAGAAKKGGTSLIKGVLDYTEQPEQNGLHLLCTPGNDVESTTGLAGSGANVIVFTTGLGTPTGNAISPTIKMSSNSTLAEKMRDIIDINAGTIITGEDTIESKGEELLELIIQVANGEVMAKAEDLGQDDFIPWKRGISL